MNVNKKTGVVAAEYSSLGDWCAALGVNGTGGDCENTTGLDPSGQGDHGTCFSTRHVSGMQNSEHTHTHTRNALCRTVYKQPIVRRLFGLL